MSEPTKVFTAHIPLSLADRIDQMAEQLEHTRAWVIKQAEPPQNYRRADGLDQAALSNPSFWR